MTDILIVGGGFAGVWAALGAASARASLRRRDRGPHITLITREPYLTIRPRLYEASLDGVRVPLAGLLADAGVELVVGDVSDIDAEARSVTYAAGEVMRTRWYDRLILAAGSQVRPAAIPGATRHLFNVDTYAAAARLQRHLLELADGPRRDGRFGAVIVGAGLAGLEVATTMVSRLRALATRPGDRPEVVLIDRSDRIAPDLGEHARPSIEAALRSLGIGVRLGTSVAEVHADYVMLASGEQIPAATAVWTAGLSANPLTWHLPVERDLLGRIDVDPYLRAKGIDGVLVAGDAARAYADRDHVLPMSCQYAIPMGERAGRNAVAELTGGAPAPLAPAPYVTCIDLGDWGGLFTEGWDRRVRLSGFWGKVMKESINTRLIVPTGPRGVVLAGARRGVDRFAA